MARPGLYRVIRFTMAIEIHPLPAAFGAEIRGLDLRDVTDADFGDWQGAFEQHAVLVFHDQDLTDAEHVAVSERFGELEIYVDPKDQAIGFPTVIRVSNVERDTGRIKPVNDIGHKSFTLGTGDWHIDSSFRRIPSRASLLYAREVPERDGDTAFANVALAYDALPDSEKREIEGLVVVHDFEHARRRFGLPPRPEAVRKAAPPVRQPLVHTLPDGRRSLFIGMHAAGIENLDPGEGRALLDRLKEWATQDRFVYRHEWRVGDLVMWDNRCTMHRAMPYDLENSRRVLHRTTVAGDGPVI